MPTNVAQYIAGPAQVQYRGATFWSQGDISLTPVFESFPIVVDRWQEVDQRVNGQSVKIGFVPAGQFTNAIVAALYPYAGLQLGQFITPVLTFGTVTAAADTVAIPLHGLITGDAVRVSASAGATLPAGFVAATLYYVSAVDANTLKFYATQAQAIAGGAPGLVDITTAGTGTTKLVVNNPLVITSYAGVQFTFWNAAVTQMPGLNPSADNTLFEAVEFEAFIKEGAAWADANSLYSIASGVAAPSDATFDRTQILTQPAGCVWGAVAPWSAFSTKAGAKFAYALSLEPITTDAEGVLTRRLTGLKVSVQAQPIGVSELDVMSALLMQGAGAVRGRSLSGADFVVTSTGFVAKVFGAALMGGPQKFGVKSDRVDALTWQATRTFTTGVANPLFYLGTS